MRWLIVSLLLLFLATSLVAAIAAQTEEADLATFVPPPDRALVRGSAGMPDWSKAQPMVTYQTGRGVISDECPTAVPFTLTVDSPSFADQVVTTLATISDTDPVQSCTWGGPAVNSHSVWWRVTVPEDGQLAVRTVSENPNRYDTVVSIYPAGAGCGALGIGVEIGCDDDSQAFQSEARALVDAGETYLVEISSWGDGSDGEDLELDLFVYYRPASQWRVSNTGLPHALTRHMAASDGRYLYILGGQTPILSDNVYRYDPMADFWSELPPLPKPYSNTDAAYVNGRIYVPSGYAGTVPYDGLHYSYSISNTTWSLRASMPVTEPIGWGAAASDPTGGVYYYTGGRFGVTPDIPLPHVYRYDINSDTWHNVTPPMKTARYAHQAALLDGRLCVIGGIGEGGEILSSGECYDFGSRSWSPIADLNIPRYMFGSETGADGGWYLFGGTVGSSGTDSRTTAKTEVYDPLADVWTLLDQRWSLNQSRRWPAGARVGPRIYATGGDLGNGRPVVDSVEYADAGSVTRYLPVIVDGMAPDAVDRYEPNDALPMAFGPLIPDSSLLSSFAQLGDSEDFFWVQTSVTGTIHVTLTDVPQGVDYDLYLYAGDKLLLASSTNPPHSDESLSTTAAAEPGDYYVRIRNVTWQVYRDESYSLQIIHLPNLAKSGRDR